MQTAPIDFQVPSAEPALVLPPEPSRLFAERAARFAALARGHSLADWLGFLGRLAQAQHDILQTLPPLFLPDAGRLEEACRHGMPPLAAASLMPPSAWVGVLRLIAATLERHAPEPARQTLAALQKVQPEWLDRLAIALLTGQPEPEDRAEMPFVGAALEVVWTAMASRLGKPLQPLPDAPGVCPCCGSLPVASLVRSSPVVNNLRYLHCSLCNTQWNLPRAVCTACSSDKGVAYQHIEGGSGAVRAETCDGCRSYLKQMVQDKDAQVDPVADDLASLALDLLVDEAGYRRSGPNLLLVGGAGE